MSSIGSGILHQMLGSLEKSFWVLSLLVVALTFSGTWLSHLNEFEVHNVTVVWPVGALTLWLMLRYGLAIAPASVLGYELYHVLYISPYSEHLVLISIINTLSCWLPAALYNAFANRRSRSFFTESSSILFFALLVAPLMSVSSAVLGNAVLLYFGSLDIDNLGLTLSRWVISDLTGIILFCPALLLLNNKVGRFRWVVFQQSFLVVFITLIAVTWVSQNISLDQYPTLLLILPVCGWIALQDNTVSSVLSLTVLTIGCMMITLGSRGELSGQDILIVPLYGSAIMVVSLLLHATDQSRNRLVKELILQKGQLESAVAERTRELVDKVAELDRLTAVLENQSLTDHLTQILNRRGFERALVDQIAASRRYGKPFALIMFDIDYFKQVNDNYGHKAGDECLKKVTDCVGHVIREGIDKFGRLGGEEFACILPGTTTDGAALQAERIRAAVEKLTLTKGSQKYNVTISAGVTVVVDTTQSASALCLKWTPRYIAPNPWAAIV